MSTSPQGNFMKTLRAYAFAALSVAGALLLTLAIAPARQKSPYLLLTLGVMVSASWGVGPGLFATLLGAVMGDYFLVPPLYTFVPSAPADVVPLFLFCSVGVAITWISHGLHLSRSSLLAANHTLAEAQRRTDAILESISDGFNVFDREWRYAYVNSAGARMVGKSREELLGRNVWELWPAAADSPFGVAYRRAVAENVPVEVEAFYPEPLNKWYEVRCYPSPEGLSLFFNDVTERKRAEEQNQKLLAAVQEEKDRLSAVISSMSDEVWLADVHKKFALANPSALRAFNLAGSAETDVEELAARLDVRRGDGSPRPVEEAPPLRALRGEVVRNEEEIVRTPGTGQLRHRLVSATPVKDASGNIVGSVSVVRDVTERRLAEEALHQQHAWLHVTLDSIGDAVLATDEDGRISFLNPVAAELTGWAEEEALGEPAGDVFRIINEQTHETAEDIIARVLQDAVVVALANHTALLSRDGREIPIEDSAAPIKDSAGRVLGVVLVFHDVTEKRRAQDRLRDSAGRFLTLANAIPQLCWMANADGWISWYNRRWYEYTGTTPDQMEGWGWQSVHDPEALPEVMERWQVSIDTGEPFDMVFPLRGADGVFRPFLTRVMPVRGRDGKVARWFGTNTDISERTKMEQELRESEERYRMLFETMIEGFCIIEVIFDADGKAVDYRFLDVNPAFEGRTGLKNARGRLMRELVPEHEAHWFEIYGHVALTGEPARFVNEAKALNRWYDVSAYRVGGPESRKVAILFNDITQRKKAAEAQAASESRLRALLESASQGVVAVDETGRMVLVNARTEEMFGYTRDELLGQPLEILLPERYRAGHAGQMHRYFEHPHTRLMGPGLDLYGRSKDGSEFPLEVSLSSVEQGGSRLAMALITDITERRNAEERLWQAQKLESIGLLAGGVAHDFNNLLVGVIGNASLAREILPSSHEAVELLDGVLSTGERLAHLTRQMLAYAGKGRFLVEPLNLSDLMPELSGLVQHSIPKKIELHYDLEPDVPPVEADRGQLQQVFMNLVLNAAESMGSNAGVISVKTGLQVVDEAYIRRNPEAVDLQPGSYVCLEVRDTGCGMDKATKAKVFDPFFSTKFQGRGLGLAAVSGIVRGHKGAITVSSTPGQGSSFTVLFPAAEGAAADSPVAALDATLHGAGTILIVDDEEVVRAMAKKGLERYGYRVLLAESGLAAIDVFKRHPGDISLVVLDLSMPEMGGEEALPALRAIRPGVKVMLLSGYSEAETMRLFAGQQVSGFLQKPFLSARLAEKVKRALE
jgi:PAS domain S-box-containing protein